MYDARLVHVVNSRDDLAHETACLSLIQAATRVDVLDEITTPTELGDKVVRIVRLQYLVQLHYVPVSQALQQVTLSLQILSHVGVILGPVLVHDLDCYL